MRTVVGVMGSGKELAEDAIDIARTLGRLIAEEGWVLLNGGRACGVMDASARGAKEAGGLVVGVLPDSDSRQASPHLDVAIRTGIGDARNYVNVLTSDVVIALPGGAGTLSEVALALKAGRHVVTIAFPLGEAFASYESDGTLHPTETAEQAMDIARRLIAEGVSHA